MSAASSAAPSPASDRRHVPALDGIRGLAALLVMIFHFGRVETTGAGAKALGFLTQFGWGGVDLFFVLSGYLIGGILLDARDKPKFLRTFYARRSLRIFPLYFVFIALFLWVILPLLPDSASDIGARQGWLWSYLANVDIARHGWYSGGGAFANQLWSLAIEEQFYLVAPFAVLVFSRRRLTALAVLGVIGAITARPLLASMGFLPRFAYVFTLARVDGLCLGLLIALMARRAGMLAKWTPVARVIVPAAAAFLLVFAWWNGTFGMADWPTLQIALPVLTIGCAALLLLTVSPTGSPAVQRVFSSRALRFFGVYSYGLYVWHPLVGAFVRRAGLTQVYVETLIGSSAVALVVVLIAKIVAAIGVALVSYAVIERPYLKLKDAIPAAGSASGVSASPLVPEAR
jgi:peptidoglycan/LPS O-acetylase OafA/YrhL